MDRSQRRELKQIIEMLEDCHGKLQGMSAEEETKYYNLPPSLQDSENGEALEDNAEKLWDAWSDLEMVIGTLKSI